MISWRPIGKGSWGRKTNAPNISSAISYLRLANRWSWVLDEVDQVFQHPEIATDFFGLLRAWHERSKNEPTWQQLRMVIVHSQEVYIPLNMNQSPFNVGLPIELPEFTPAQVEELVQRHGLDWTAVDVEQLLGVVDGHPYPILFG